MPHFGIPDTRAFDRAVIRAGNAAFGLLCRAGAWSVHQLTDGHVPAEVADQLGTPVQARKLVDAGLWTRDGDGYQIVDWTASNRTPEPARARAHAGGGGGVRPGAPRGAPKNDPENVPNPASNAAKSSAPQEKTSAKNSENGGSTPPDQAQLEPMGSGRAEPLPCPTLPYPDAPSGASRTRDARVAQLPDELRAVVEAWQDGIGGSQPSPKELRKIIGSARDRLAAGDTLHDVVAGARRAGAEGGFADITVGVRKVQASQRPAPGPLDDRVAGWQALRRTPRQAARHEPPGEVLDGEVVELRPAAGGEH